MPAAVKDWKAIDKSRPEDRKKVDQKTRKFLPMSDAVIEQHLLGKETVGVYLLLPDETCRFLAADFDKKTWEYDAQAFLETCQELNVPAVLERSRSGKGGHIWIFFERALSAITARKLGCVILTRTMERRRQLGLDSYDRFFPNQDTMPKGALGNLIALPLQYASRKADNSVFIDSAFRPYPDQWQFLSTIRRMPDGAAEGIVAEAQRKDDLIGVRISIADDEEAQDPWTLPPSRKRKDRLLEGPLPKTVQIIRANLVYVEKKDLAPAMLNRLLRLAAFQNPEFYKAQAMRLSTYDKPRVIACAKEFAQHIALPRGCLTEALALLAAHKIRPEVRDERYEGTAIQAEFQGQLRPFQEEAVAKITDHDERYIVCSNSVRKNSRWGVADRETQGQHAGRGPPPTVARPVAGTPRDVPGPACQVDRAYRWGQDGSDGLCGRRCDPEPVPKRRSEGLRRRVRTGEAGKARYVVGLTATPTRKDGRHPIITCSVAQYGST